MNTKMLRNMFIILLPVMAAVLATTRDSVLVYETAGAAAVSGSYFDLIPQAGNMKMLPPISAMLTLACAVLAVLYVVLGKQKCLKALPWLSFAAVTVSTLPYVIQGQVLVMPNVGLPLMLAVLFALTYPSRKKTQEAPQGQRLEKR